MTDHSIFIEAHPVEDGAKDVAMVVLCSCGNLLWEGEGQLLLDDAVEVAWNHRS